MVILTVNIYVLWLLVMFEPVLGDWSTGDWIILVNNGLADPNKVLEFNTGSPNYPTNPHPVFMANDPGNAMLGTWDYWYVTTNTDNSYKIYNAYNKYALDTASDDTTPIMLPVDNQKVQGWVIQQNADGTFSIYNHGLNKYLGLENGGWPTYMDSATASYTHWSFLPAITISTVTATSTQTITSINGASTSTVTGPSVTETSTVFVTTTRIITVVAPTLVAKQLARRWVASISIITTTITTTTVAHVDSPLAYITIPAGTVETTVTSELTVSSTSTSTARSISGTLSSSLSSLVSSQTSSAAQVTVTSTSTQSPAAKSGAGKRCFVLVYLIVGIGLALVVHMP